MSDLYYNVNRFSQLTEEINNAIVLALTRVITGEHLATTTTTNYTAATSAASASSSSYGVGPGWPIQHSPQLRPSPLMGPHGVGLGMSSWQGAGSSAGRDARKRNRYKGVRKRRSGKWGAEIRNKHKAQPNEWLGTYETEEEAVMAYDKAAIRLHGDRARLNFPLNRQNEPPEAGDS